MGKNLGKSSRTLKLKAPADASARAGAKTKKSRAALTDKYQAGFARAIVSFRIGPDMLVVSFAFAEKLT